MPVGAAIASDLTLESFQAGRQMIRRGRRHIVAADLAAGISALVPAARMQEVRLQRFQLRQHLGLGPCPQGQRPQVFRLGPDALGSVAHLALGVSIASTAPAVTPYCSA